MIPAGLYLLAEAGANGPSDLLHVGAGLVIAFAALGGIALVLFRGFWAKNIEPLITNVVNTWWSDGARMLARDADVLKTVSAWYTSPDTVQQRTIATKLIIDNEIRRDDGLIHREIKTKLDNGIAPVLEQLESVTDALRARDEADAQFRQQVLTSLAKIQGAMSGQFNQPLQHETPVSGHAHVPPVPVVRMPPPPTKK